ncbi:hypothetical protein ACFL6N_03405 [Thermodesulfobacteriota bacterium]
MTVLDSVGEDYPIVNWDIDFGYRLSSVLDGSNLKHAVAHNPSTNELFYFHEDVYDDYVNDDFFSTLFVTSVNNSDTNKNTQYSSIDLDENNQPYICYTDLSNNYLYLQSFYNDVVVDDSGNSSKYCDIVINDTINIFYYDKINKDLIYAVRVNDTWEFSTIDSDGDVGSNVVAEVDSQGFFHLIYNSLEDSSLKYATNRDGYWAINYIDLNVTDSIDHCSNQILVDSDDTIHIAYTVWGNNLIVYSKKSSGTWESSQAHRDLQLTTPYVEMNISLALDSHRTPFITYYYHGNLWYTKQKKSGEWIQFRIDSKQNVGSYSSLLIDNYDTMHIYYYDQDNKRMKYAYSTN